MLEGHWRLAGRSACWTDMSDKYTHQPGYALRESTADTFLLAFQVDTHTHTQKTFMGEKVLDRLDTFLCTLNGSLGTFPMSLQQSPHKKRTCGRKMAARSPLEVGQS